MFKFQDVFQTLDKFLRAIKNEKRSIDGIFLAVMGHGSNDNIIASDGKEIDIFTEIIERFGNGNCHNLMGVPQIFVIQTCRYVKMSEVKLEIKRMCAMCA